MVFVHNPYCFLSGCTNLCSYQQFTSVSFSPYPRECFLCVVVLMIAILTGVRWYLFVFLICMSLIITFRYDLNQIPYDYTVEVRNRFKGLDLIDRVPDELWSEVRDIVQETGIKAIPKKKKCKKAKWLSEEALQIAVERREAKSKGEEQRYSHLNAEFQRIARRDNKAFLSDQCKEIEENNRMGKIGDLF